MNRTQAPAGSPDCAPGIHARDAFLDEFADRARHAPERIAISWDGGESWTYAQLLHRAHSVAHALLDHGVQRGDIIGIFFPRRPEMVAAALGIMFAGAAYLPLDPVFPIAQLDDMAKRACIQDLVVWRTDEVPAALRSQRTCLQLDGFDAGQPANDTTLPAVAGDELAYVLFTSGSTGRPKGVRVLHRNLSNFIGAARRMLGIGTDDVVGAFTTLAFDPVVLDVFLPLSAGARLALAREEDKDSPAAAVALWRAHGVTMLGIPPTHLRLLSTFGLLHELDGKTVWAGGEVLQRDLANAVVASCRSLWNLYGPTETTVASTAYEVRHGDGPVPIGKPVARTAVYILDDRQVPVADGEVGEIWIGGAGVAGGYLHDAATTAERFWPDPFAEDGSRMYRTGDLGARRAGILYFHGRLDDQIKLNGFRIEPGEIEAAALAEPGIREAAAISHQLQDGDVRLALYVVAKPDADLVTRLRASLRRRLPEYVRLHYVEVLDQLPLTPNGKVDRKALPLPKALADFETESPAGSAATPIATASGSRRDHHAFSTLVPLQPHGDKPPLFFIHASGGSVRNYVPLARSLGADQPVYGIQAIGLDGMVAPLASIEGMTDCYATEIRRLQPHGPYFLAGGSMGGLVAWELARQLREQGETVGLLAMLDTCEPRYGREGNRAAPPTLLRLLWAPLGRLRRKLDARRVQRYRAKGRALPPALRQREIARAHQHAMDAFRPRPCGASAILFRAVEQVPEGADATMGWKDYARGGIEVTDIACRHDNLVENPELLRGLRLALQRSHAAA